MRGVPRGSIEQLQYNLLFKWFVGLQIEENVWNATTFTKNRDRLLNEQIARSFFSSTVKRAEKKRLLSDEHFTLDGSLIESFASLKSYRPKDKSDGDPESFHGQKRRTCGADKGYDTRRFAKIARTNRFTPHAAAKKFSGAIELRTTRHPGYLISQRKRKRVEEIFGWGKTSVH